MAETGRKPTAKFEMVSPELVAPHVLAARECYRDTLGFQVLSYFLDRPVFVMLARGAVESQLSKSGPGTPPSPNHPRRCGLGPDAFSWGSDLDGLHDELKSRGAKIIDPPTLEAYPC